MKSGKNTNISRRKFINTSAKTFAGISLLPAFSLVGNCKTQPSDKLNIAGIGIGGMGKRNLRFMNSENIVALCDVDLEYAAGVFQQYPDAKVYQDYRIMFDEMYHNIDAVMIATPDHTHAIIASEAMKRGKHVFLQKPMGHSIYEVRELARLARETNVATQLGNQANSDEGIRTACEWIWDGAIGVVTKIEAWSDRPYWHQAVGRPSGEHKVPDTLNWDLFVGPAKMRPYSKAYTPFQWHGWWDFGTGVLGDMSGHVLDMPFWALHLGPPKSIYANTSQITTESFPRSSIVHFEFPARKLQGGTWLPPVDLTWYDGGLMPPLPKELKDEQRLGVKAGGVLMNGTKGTLMTSCFGCNPILLPESLNQSYERPEKLIRRIDNAIEGGHEQDWIRACKEDPLSRIEPSANFKSAVSLNETAILGNIAIRLQGLGKRLFWDTNAMEFTNIYENEEVKTYNIDFLTAYDNYPHEEKHLESFNAKAIAQDMIKHSYRDGWSL